MNERRTVVVKDDFLKSELGVADEKDRGKSK